MLEGKNISFVRENTTLFAGLSFSLKHGEKLSIKGANGSGKSTFLRLLTGLLPLKTDQLFWNGEMVSKTNLSSYQQNFLYVGHKLCLHPEIRVEDQLHLWHTLYKVPKNSMTQALENWGIHSLKHKKISQLSQGQQKRLALSRCHWLKRSLWILDEPETALDQEGQRLLEDTLAMHLEEGRMVVQATHEFDTPPSPAHSLCEFTTSPTRGAVILHYENPSPLVGEGAPQGRVRGGSCSSIHEIIL